MGPFVTAGDGGAAGGAAGAAGHLPGHACQQPGVLHGSMWNDAGTTQLQLLCKGCVETRLAHEAAQLRTQQGLLQDAHVALQAKLGGTRAQLQHAQAQLEHAHHAEHGLKQENLALAAQLEELRGQSAAVEAEGVMLHARAEAAEAEALALGARVAGLACELAACQESAQQQLADALEVGASLQRCSSCCVIRRTGCCADAASPPTAGKGEHTHEWCMAGVQERDEVEADLRGQVQDLRALEAARGALVPGDSLVPELVAARLRLEQLQARLHVAERAAAACPGGPFRTKRPVSQQASR